MGEELTKSLFLTGLHCVKRLYLTVRSPGAAEPPTEADRYRMEQGRRLGETAREAFPGGVLVGPDPGLAVDETRKALESGADVLFEAAFVSDGCFVRCDVLRRTHAGWDVIEVKASSKVKDEHITDLAFQVMVVESAGLTVSKTFVMHLDREKGRGDPGSLFTLTDVTGPVRDELGAVRDQAAALRRVLQSTVPPDERTNTHCENPPCPFYAPCHEGRPDDDLVFLPGIRRTAVVRFRDEGIETIRQIPADAKLTPAQHRARQVVSNGAPFLSAGLREALAAVRFPAHFVDFETAAPAVPLHTGLGPYESFPFQWSDHVLVSPDSEAVERSYLHDGKGDPREEFARTLFEATEDAQKVVFYSPYELSTLKALAVAGVPLARELVERFTQKGFDLLTVVREHVYFETFRGSFSIKAVLPAVVPGLSYQGLAIKSGETAAIKYLELTSDGLSSAARQETRRALLEYCALDTLAMVRLYKRLTELAP
ncbi:MAG: DUF2779 domain-containing protein [Armatimonadetes bacterium]|nr:DUF2779 domain-containing protein [Armatimonadota bacterium]